MIWKLDTGWLMMAVATIVVLAFFFGSALDAIMKDDGFGSIGNMLIFVAGFFLAICGANWYGITFHDLKFAVATGLVGAFACLSVLAIGKAVATRL